MIGEIVDSDDLLLAATEAINKHCCRLRCLFSYSMNEIIGAMGELQKEDFDLLMFLHDKEEHGAVVEWGTKSPIVEFAGKRYEIRLGRSNKSLLCTQAFLNLLRLTKESAEQVCRGDLPINMERERRWNHAHKRTFIISEIRLLLESTEIDFLPLKNKVRRLPPQFPRWDDLLKYLNLRADGFTISLTHLKDTSKAFFPDMRMDQFSKMRCDTCHKYEVDMKKHPLGSDESKHYLLLKDGHVKMAMAERGYVRTIELGAGKIRRLGVYFVDYMGSKPLIHVMREFKALMGTSVPNLKLAGWVGASGKETTYFLHYGVQNENANGNWSQFLYFCYEHRNDHD
eukprot:gene11382-3400_t